MVACPARSAPTASFSMAASRIPAPGAVKTERLRRALRAVLTAAPEPAPDPAIGAGGGPWGWSTDIVERNVQPWSPSGREPVTGEVIEPETIAHWWCRRCGRWEVCNDADLCLECAYMVATRRRHRRARVASPPATPSTPVHLSKEIGTPWP